MLQEYLFPDDKNKEEISNIILPDKVDLDIEEFDNTDSFVIKISMSGNNETTAKTLSEIDVDLLEKYNPIILTNGCSSYFNKRLFPLINDFERLLRKLLYLANVFSGEEFNVSNLEKSNLDDIFKNLFYDKSFLSTVKKEINGKPNFFLKKEIVSIINDIPEIILWNKIFNGQGEILQNNYSLIKDYRNDVMHAHNINYHEFKKAKRLFQRTNEELVSIIGGYISIVENSEDDRVTIKNAMNELTDNLLHTSGAVLGNLSYEFVSEFTDEIIKKFFGVKYELDSELYNKEYVSKRLHSNNIEKIVRKGK